jgi:hypothetical protein
MVDQREAIAARWGLWAFGLVGAGFIAGMCIVSACLPDPADGPTPAGTRVAYFAVFAALLVGLALIPLGMWAVERRGGLHTTARWRLVVCAGVVLAVCAFGWGVWTWAYPPHNLHQCFAVYRGNGHSGIAGHVCRSRQLNRPLGLHRLNEGIGVGLVLLAATGIAVLRMQPRPQ